MAIPLPGNAQHLRVVLPAMCAICGIVDLAEPPGIGAMLQRANQAGQHRGPDDEGLVLIANTGQTLVRARTEREPDLASPLGAWRVGLAHRRLSILDLSSAGHQPMNSRDGALWVVFNGEIYNYLELREELKALGFHFRSRSDTEVILTAYAAWGRECLQRFNGMWAFALYDQKKKVLFCARDRFGVKPFLYQVSPGRFTFASEFKQMRQLRQQAWHVNPAILGDFFLWKLSSHEAQTPVDGVLALPPSHFLELTEEALRIARLEPCRYWAPRPRDGHSSDDPVAEFRDLLTDSLRLRLRSDVPVGVTLSGGLDSSALTCLAASAGHDNGNGPLKAFTVVYSDQGYSEEEFAAMAAKKAGASHLLIRPESTDLQRDWDEFIRVVEVPFCSLSYFSNWEVYRAIRSAGVKVVLSGQGGDELLLGYQRYRVPMILFCLRRGEWRHAAGELCRTPGHGGISLWNLLPYFAYFGFPAVRGWRRERLAGSFIRPEFRAAALKRSEHFVASSTYRNRADLQVKEYFHYQLPDLLHYDDRVSMSHGCEARQPFLDYRLLELVLSIPDDMLVRGGWSKWILRQALTGVLPEPIRLRKDKMGFSTPTGRLFRDNKVFFTGLMQRQRNDPFVDVPALLAAHEKQAVEDTLLCSVCSYFTWREQFDVLS